MGAVGESIMQVVQLFSPSFTAELFLRQKRPIIFVFLLSTHSIFVMLPIHVKLWCTIHTCLGSEKLLFSVKYVTGNTVVFINKDLFLDKIWRRVIYLWWGEEGLLCHVDKHVQFKRGGLSVWVISSPRSYEGKWQRHKPDTMSDIHFLTSLCSIGLVLLMLWLSKPSNCTPALSPCLHKADQPSDVMHR